MKKMFYVLGMAALMASCTSSKTEKEAVADEAKVETEASVEGMWRLTEYVADGKTVKVADDADYTINFEPSDSTFGIRTDCNTIGGKYLVNADSLKFESLYMTRMACPEPVVENAMNQILPTVETYSIDKETLTLKGADAAVVAKFAKTADDKADESAE